MADEWMVLAKRLAKPTDSAAVRRVGYKIVRMKAHPCSEQEARGYAAQGDVWNGGTVEAYVHTAMPWSYGLNTLAQFDKDVECAQLALIGESLAQRVA